MEYIQTDPQEAVLSVNCIARAIGDLEKKVDVERGIILDLCCGTGNMTTQLQKRYPLSTVCGLEYNPYHLRKAKDQGVRVLLGNANALPFWDATVDLVLTSKVYDYTYTYPKCSSSFSRIFPDSIDLDQMLREVHRILKPGGIYIPWADFELREHPFLEQAYKRLGYVFFEKKKK